MSYAVYDHPYELFRELRDRAYYNPRLDLSVLSPREDVSACLRNHDQLVKTIGDDVDGTHARTAPVNLVGLDLGVELGYRLANCRRAESERDWRVRRRRAV